MLITFSQTACRLNPFVLAPRLPGAYLTQLRMGAILQYDGRAQFFIFLNLAFFQYSCQHAFLNTVKPV